MLRSGRAAERSAPALGLAKHRFVGGEGRHCLLKKYKFARRELRLCLFCKNREEKIDLEASRFGFRSEFEADPYDVVDGLADWIRKRDRWR